MIVTEAMNQACWRNSRHWNGRFGRPRATSSPKAKSFPAVPIGRSARADVIEDIPDQAPVGCAVESSKDPGGGSMPCSSHHEPGSRWLRRGLPLLGSICSGIGGGGGGGPGPPPAGAAAGLPPPPPARARPPGGG